MINELYSVNSKGHLVFDGMDTVELAEKYGTPSMFLSENSVRQMCRMYKKAFSESFGGESCPIYAGKALCFKKLYEVLKEEEFCADCVSSGEIETARAAGYPMENVFFHGNNKTDDDLARAVGYGVGHIVVDGIDELYALNDICGRLGKRQKILLRITPGIDPHTHKKIITGNVDSKFGSAVSTGQAETVVRLALNMENLDLEGLHCHVGSQIFDIEPFRDGADIMLAFINDMKKRAGYKGTILNIGGGFGVRYTEDDPEIDYVKNIKALGDEIDKICAELNMEKPTVMMEPGRSIVAAAGMTLYTVGSVKEIPGFRAYVSVDGGMTDNPRYTLYQSRYSIYNASRMLSEDKFECTLAGRCCESGDLLAEGITISRPERGDIVAVAVTGAYNYSMSSNYNRIPRPPVVMIKDGETYIGIRRETYEDILSLDE